jgi:hypothetical protein
MLSLVCLCKSSSSDSPPYTWYSSHLLFLFSFVSCLLFLLFSFVLKTKDEGTGRTNMAFFLLIYAPKRGLMEIWKMRHGTVREAVVNVGIGCVLLNTHSLLGCPSIPTRLADEWSRPRCYLLQPDGNIQEILISRFNLTTPSASVPTLSPSSLNAQTTPTTMTTLS